MALPAMTTSIGSDTFAMCSGLQTITLPEALKSVGIMAFFGCDNLKPDICEELKQRFSDRVLYRQY